MSSAHRYNYTRADGSVGERWRAKWRDREGMLQAKRGFKTKAEALAHAEEVTRRVVLVEVPVALPRQRESANEDREQLTEALADLEQSKTEIRRLKRELANLRARWTKEEGLRAYMAELATEEARSAVAEEHLKFQEFVTAALEVGLQAIDLYRGGFAVYLLRDEAGEVVYVGQSTNVLARLGQHARNPLKERARTATVLRCESYERMCAAEAFLIDRLQPELNVLGVGDRAYRSRAEGHSWATG